MHYMYISPRAVLDAHVAIRSAAKRVISHDKYPDGN